jgi:hypothetical protein
MKLVSFSTTPVPNFILIRLVVLELKYEDRQKDGRMKGGTEGRT